MVARVLKAKYFVKTEFLSAKIGSNSSYLWRSILEGRKLLNKVILWRVGNGDAIHVWDDPWIPVPTSFRVAQHSKHLWPGARVRNLIDYESGSWKMHLLNALFLKHEAELIKEIPLSACWPQDEIV